MNYKPKIGQKVQIKQWDEMVRENSLNNMNIQLAADVFMSEMKCLCGLTFIVAGIRETSYPNVWQLIPEQCQSESFARMTGGCNYNLFSDMVEPCIRNNSALKQALYGR